ncbi:glycoside hydrolase family 16 protein [Clostridium chauvoei]|uniref:Glycoside hydrolase family 16 protein n=2 Tax=Clostridium chauvoei TaxID=46867 RepID=A0ABD4RKN0_9CLOT|nr:glycoside hydrolase family 16 protein [Clostridium chauvoei]ATD54106.1 hypothetical protein BTM20_02180 [Clostridium chauvoei]MBX7281820.1 glycoside hydrolase family 16 protein [Clostridium chauvoei]MBX7284343.1 glycoside hydrolase family 16 protein [Clostridium chauvoei]MBX7286857.1 glycoside hydrolase family 16 protein [Clostridium chauvoei]MBX7289390.1 glycoside hydrolase family 16 protein [Clostridium chauvoei]
MKKNVKVFIATAMALTVFGTIIPTRFKVNAAEKLIKGGDFESLSTQDIRKYNGILEELENDHWYSKGEGKVSYSGAAESERAGMLSENNGDTWIGQVVNVEKNTDYVMTVKVRNSLPGCGVTVEVKGVSGSNFTGDLGVQYPGGSEWKDVTIEFNSGNNDKVMLRVLKYTEDQNSDTYKSATYVDDLGLFTEADYKEYISKLEKKTKLINYVNNGDFVTVNDADLMKNGGDQHAYPVGTWVYQASNDNVAEMSEGYGENSKGVKLPADDGNTWVRQVVQVEANKDYLLKLYIKHDDANAGTTIAVNNMDFAGIKEDYAGGSTWKEYTVEFNSGDNEKAIVGVIKWNDNNSSPTYTSGAYISNVRLYEKENYEQVKREEAQEEVESDKSKYTEVWRDDFNTLDLNTWRYELGHKRGTEEQEYVDSNENVFVQDGNLYLRATKKDKYKVKYKYDGTDQVLKYNSGSIETFGARDVLYGKIEMRAKLPKGKGAFPAFWTLGSDFTLDGLIDGKQGTGWPMCGEIDIVEMIGYNPEVGGTSDNAIHGTLHYGFSGEEDTPQTSHYDIGKPLNDDFHTFGINWTPEYIEWYIDDHVYSKIYISELDYFQKPHYLKFNLAVGGTWPGYADETTEFPMDFIIDYVSYSQTKEQKAAADAYYANSPKITGVKDITISNESELTEVLKNVSATDVNGNPLEVSCTVEDGRTKLWNGRTRTSEIDFDLEGTYNITYTVIGENNVYTREYAKLHVVK